MSTQRWKWIRFFNVPNTPPKKDVPAPVWRSGLDTCSREVFVAYIPDGEDIKDYFPNAIVDVEEIHEEMQFSDRYPEPRWWAEQRKAQEEQSE